MKFGTGISDTGIWVCHYVDKINLLNISFSYFQIVWAESTTFKDLGQVPADPVEFWSGVQNYSATGKFLCMHIPKRVLYFKQNKFKVVMKRKLLCRWTPSQAVLKRTKYS